MKQLTSHSNTHCEALPVNKCPPPPHHTQESATHSPCLDLHYTQITKIHQTSEGSPQHKDRDENKTMER